MITLRNVQRFNRSYHKWTLIQVKDLQLNLTSIEFFTISISARSSRSDRCKGQLPFSVLCVLHICWCIDSSKGHSSEITITSKIWIIIIHKNSILYLSDLADLSELVIVKNGKFTSNLFNCYVNNIQQQTILKKAIFALIFFQREQNW